MSEKLTTIRLYGQLGTKFGRVHKFVCSDTAGAVRALCNMIPGFQAYLNESKAKGLAFACFIGKQNINEDGLRYPVGSDDIRIAPIITGSGRGGLFSVIIGVALVAGAFFTGGATLAGGTLAFSGIGGMAAFGLGVMMITQGVSSFLVKQPEGITAVESPDNGSSYNFNGPVQVSAQGGVRPVLYGEAIIGSVTVAGDMYAEDIQ